MITEDYIIEALKTESIDMEALKLRLSDEKTIRGLHSSLGLVTEASEFADVFKKHIFYGKEIDWINLEEEAGDLFWYLAILADVIGQKSFDSMFKKNVEKLAKRYKNQVFTEDSAINRNVSEERKILEKEHHGK